MKGAIGATARGPRRGRLDATLWICLLVLCLGRAGCSSETHYGALSFFFDGVPTPEALAKARGSTDAARRSPTYSVHKPYAEEQCAECHAGKRFLLSTRDSDLCMKCHADQTTRHTRMHGPVVAVACLWCHSPHDSAEAALLKKPAREVCGQCHEPAMLNVERTPAHADAARSCLECHFGHGGDAPFYLRAGTAGGPQRNDAPGPAPR